CARLGRRTRVRPGPGLRSGKGAWPWPRGMGGDGMKIAVTAQGETLNDLVDARFGRAKTLLIADSETGEAVSHDRSMALDAARGAGIRAAQEVAQLGAGVLITGNVGPNAFRALTAAGISVYLTSDCTAAEALERFRRNELTEQKVASVEGHRVAVGAPSSADDKDEVETR
ncbi:MAG: NifB/NifX family molybdenum-iron cluster-binding protein, partial [Actinomycetota bacterium]